MVCSFYQAKFFILFCQNSVSLPIFYVYIDYFYFFNFGFRRNMPRLWRRTKIRQPTKLGLSPKIRKVLLWIGWWACFCHLLYIISLKLWKALDFFFIFILISILAALKITMWNISCLCTLLLTPLGVDWYFCFSGFQKDRRMGAGEEMVWINTFTNIQEGRR